MARVHRNARRQPDRQGADGDHPEAPEPCATQAANLGVGDPRQARPGGWAGGSTISLPTLDDFSHVAWISSASRRLCGIAHKRLADSNLDIGQAEGYLIRYVEQHPEVIVEPAGPQAGTILVRVNRLTGVPGGRERYACLRENFEPEAIAYACLIYEILPDDLEAIEPWDELPWRDPNPPALGGQHSTALLVVVLRTGGPLYTCLVSDG